jgi:hypothetical protein
MPKPKTLNVLPVGDALVTDFVAMRHHQKRFIGREHDPSHGEGGGFVPTGKAVTVPGTGEFGREYIAALKNGTLAPADEATAKAAGIEFKPVPPAPKAPLPPAPLPEPVPAPSAK